MRSPTLPALLLAFCLTFTFCSTPSLAAEAEFQLRSGDRVTLLGDGFIERLQQSGYLETVLTSRLPQLNVTFRNLGWSGDNVWGEARAVFGAQPQGFERLLSDLKLTDPTVIVIAYGTNEAYGGEARLPAFEQGLVQLLDKLAATQARLVLLSPLERENVGPPLPDPAAYNAQVKQYGAAIQRIAQQRGLPYIELNPLAERDDQYRPATAAQRLTEDSLTLTEYGNWLAANRIASALGIEAQSPEIAIDVTAGTAKANGAAITNYAGKSDAAAFELKAAQLPYPAVPDHAPLGAAMPVAAERLSIEGLAPGVYRLLIDGQEAARGDSAAWAKGQSIERGEQHLQIERLRAAINTKNELFFNRHRPQNETYLFLFRKHEQGNNAVEIPQFDPLIEIKEHEIAELRVPQQRKYVLELVQ